MLSCRREFSFLEPAKVVTRSCSHDEFSPMDGLGPWLDILAPVVVSHAWTCLSLDMFCAGRIFRGHRHQATCLQDEIRGVGVNFCWHCAALRKVSRRATELWAQFYGDTVQVNAYHRQATRGMCRVGGVRHCPGCDIVIMNILSIYKQF